MTSPTKPLLSIVIPTYEMKGEGLSFFQRCLDSIKKQSHIDFQKIEIVVSDQSNDDLINSYCQTNELPIHYHRTTTGKGSAAHNLNIGITHAKGKYIKILFQDDLLVEDFYLKTLMEVTIDHAPDYIFTAALHTKDGQIFFNPIIPSNNSFFLFGNNTASSPSTLTLKRALVDSPLFDEALKMLFDCDLYYRIFNGANSVIVIDNVHIGNGIWKGQAQHHIDRKQFTKEVRYLNWKYPTAQLEKLLPEYRKIFYYQHPNATLPFSGNLHLSLLKRWVLYTKKRVFNSSVKNLN